ncbi:MAG: Xanthine phosphoribosyltransferase [Candidatus Heimdallarchaeota archaeon AB_125]|nr:MAG: Xanthine phosphoribosyltransferase [Candidatus Heimdallarchaeota archaeon AB_125]
MSSADSYIDAQEKLMTLNLLQIAFKEFETYDSMRLALQRNGVEVSIANLSRYIYGKAIPKSKLKDELLRAITQDAKFSLSIKKLIENLVKHYVDDFNNVRLSILPLLNDSKTMKAISFLLIYKEIVPRDIDKIITIEGDGVPFAMTLAHILNIDCLVARRLKPLGIDDFITSEIQKATQGRIESIGISEKSIQNQEKLLVVDDVIKSGATHSALIELVKKCNAEPVKLVFLTGIGSHWEQQKELSDIELNILKIYY